MHKRFAYIIILVCLHMGLVSVAQTNYQLKYRFADTLLKPETVGLQTTFTTKELCGQYIFQIPQVLQRRGFITASVDSVKMDSAAAQVVIFLGQLYKWNRLITSGVSPELLSAAGFRDKNFNNRYLDYTVVQQLQERILTRLENTGYPFATVSLDSVQLEAEGLTAILKVNSGPQYKIDSIRVFGNVTISNRFLQRYLEITNGSVYHKQKLMNISYRLLQLPYLEEEQKWNMNLLGSGSILNLYLKNKRNSQINGIVGFLPTTDATGKSKVNISGDFNLNLKNGFGLGESLLILFQQIQYKSPRLQLSYQQPFLFGSPFGAEFSFDGFKKDTSFLNINLQIGVQYAFGGNRSGKIFFQQFITTIDFIDTTTIRNTRKLPAQIDQTTTNVGVDYEWFNTDYRFNPRKGFDIRATASAGIRKLRPNPSIVSLKSPTDPSFDFQSLYDSAGVRSYTFRLKLNAAHFIRTGKQTTLKTALNAGLVQSPLLFRNELFQLGGFRMLRGFDEESIFASSYLVATAEYRLLTGLNSYLYAFTDGGWVRNNSQLANTSSRFLGLGLGMAFETKAGIFNLSFALGKRDQEAFNFRQTKIHFGYLNFF